MERIEKNCTPVTNVEMLNMRANEDEKERWNQISVIVIDFYKDAIKFAKTNKRTEFVFSTKEKRYGGEKFIKDNKDDIISTLKNIL